MLSIIIPTLNEEKYLPRLLDSIYKQDYKDYEVIVSDAGSTDKTSEIVKKSGLKFIVSDKIKHPSYQRNEGARIASGKVLLFLDADSVLLDGFLMQAMTYFKEQSLDAASFYIKFNPNKWYYSLYSLISNSIFFLKQRSKNPAAIGAAIMAKTKTHKLINGFDLEVLLGEDYDYCARISEVGKFRIIKKPKILYSSRRIEKEGFIITGLKWLKMGTFTLTSKKIKKQIVRYDFGEFKK